MKKIIIIGFLITTAPLLANTDSLSNDYKKVYKTINSFYNEINNQNIKGIQNLLCESSKNILSINELSKLTKYKWIYNLKKITEFNYIESNTKEVTVLRSLKDKGSIRNSERIFQLILEKGNWKLIRLYSVNNKIADDFLLNGFSESVIKDLEWYKLINDETNNKQIIKTILSDYNGAPIVMPWELQLKIKKIEYDNKGYSDKLKVTYTLHNKSQKSLEDISIYSSLYKNKIKIANNNQYSLSLEPDDLIKFVSDFRLGEEEKMTTNFALNVFYKTAYKKCLLMKGQQISCELPFKNISFDIVNLSYTQIPSENHRKINVARIDYCVKNLSKKGIEELDLYFVWKSPNDNIVCQTIDSLIGHGDLPLNAGAKKSDWDNSNVGFSNSKMEMKVDVFAKIENAEKYPIASNITIGYVDPKLNKLIVTTEQELTDNLIDSTIKQVKTKLNSQYKYKITYDKIKQKVFITFKNFITSDDKLYQICRECQKTTLDIFNENKISISIIAIATNYKSIYVKFAHTNNAIQSYAKLIDPMMWIISGDYYEKKSRRSPWVK